MLETAFIVYFVVVLIYHAGSVILGGLYRFCRWQGMKGERYPDAPKDAPLVSIVVPARNEEHNIRSCLEAITAQDYPNFEVLVLDDASEDRTAEIIQEFVQRDPRVTLLSGQPRPADWFGKPWALHCAQSHARGAFLLFVDADVRLAPFNVRHAIGYALEEQADMVSLMGHLEVDSFWEGTVQPIMGYVIVAFFPLDRVNSPRSSITMCNGQYILMRREAYDAVEGHEPIRSAILEDVALAGRVKRHGLRYRLLMAPDEFRCRMYSTFTEIWEGWSKNFFAALQYQLRWAVTALFLLLLLSFFPLVDFAWRLFTTGPEDPLFVWSAATAGSVLALRYYVSFLFGFPARFALTHPLGVVIVAGICINSVWRTLSGKGVRWKGRQYALDTRETGKS